MEWTETYFLWEKRHESYQSEAEPAEDYKNLIRYLADGQSELSRLEQDGGEAEHSAFAEAFEDGFAAFREYLSSRAMACRWEKRRFRLLTLFEALHFNEFERFAAALGYLAAADEETGERIKALEGNGGAYGPTRGLAVRLYSLAGEENQKEIGEFLRGTGSFELCIKNAARQEAFWRKRRIWLKESLISWLLGGEPWGREEDGLPELLAYEDILERAQAAALQPEMETGLLYLFGAGGSGKGLLARHLGRRLGRPVWFADGERLLGAGAEAQRDCLEETALRCLLTGGMFAYRLPGKRDGERREELQRLSFLAADCAAWAKGPWLVLGETRESLDPPGDRAFAALELPYGTPSQRERLWEHFLKARRAAADADPGMNGSKYTLTPGEIKRTLETAACLAAGENREGITQRDIDTAVKLRGRGTLGEYAALVESPFVWEDLVAERPVKRQLEQICGQLRYRSLVGERWGFFKKTPYGRGVSALFYGPPGTGKTMAAQVLANELGLDLYRVDLSKMVSKYIGETEKNISGLFERARHMNIILFFDEADSLFAKRSEVKDATDRSANSETAHLLQKMEEYEGIVILATNLMEQIDPAFRRRIRFMVKFSFPDAETRKQLWKSVLPAEAPLDPDLDLDFFAERFEISGSQIKETAVNAAFLAAAAGERLGNEQIKEALTQNYEKYGKRLTSEDFGYLG